MLLILILSWIMENTNRRPKIEIRLWDGWFLVTCCRHVSWFYVFISRVETRRFEASGCFFSIRQITCVCCRWGGVHVTVCVTVIHLFCFSCFRVAVLIIPDYSRYYERGKSRRWRELPVTGWHPTKKPNCSDFLLISPQGDPKTRRIEEKDKKLLERRCEKVKQEFSSAALLHVRVPAVTDGQIWQVGWWFWKGNSDHMTERPVSGQRLNGRKLIPV